MKFWRLVAGCCAGIALLVGLCAWLNWGELRFYGQIDLFIVDENGTPVRTDRHPGGIQVNSYTDDLSYDSIGRSYYRACHRLDALRGARPRQTYYWEDDITYPKVSSVVQYPSCYLEVLAYNGNDSDGVCVRVKQGCFLAEKHAALELLASDELPKGTLRCTWR